MQPKREKLGEGKRAIELLFMEHSYIVWIFLIHGMCNYVSHCRRSIAQSLCQVHYSHTFWIWRQLNLSCVPYDDQINGLTGFFNKHCKLVIFEGFRNHFFSVQNSDKHVSRQTGTTSLSFQHLMPFCKEGCLITRLLFSQLNYSSWSHVPVFGKTLCYER